VPIRRRGHTPELLRKIASSRKDGNLSLKRCSASFSRYTKRNLGSVELRMRRELTRVVVRPQHAQRRQLGQQRLVRTLPPPSERDVFDRRPLGVREVARERFRIVVGELAPPRPRASWSAMNSPRGSPVSCSASASTLRALSSSGFAYTAANSASLFVTRRL
jgi:hypothetical protein